MFGFIGFVCFISVVNCLQNPPENKNSEFDLKPILSIIQKSLDQTADEQQQRQNIAQPEGRSRVDTEKQEIQNQQTDPKGPTPVVSARQRQLIPTQFAPVAFIEPQFQYPGFGYVQGKQPIPR